MLLFTTGCGKTEATDTTAIVEKPEVITVRFTDPVDMEPQYSEKCIACHTKTNPITKLASPSTAGAEAGG